MTDQIESGQTGQIKQFSIPVCEKQGRGKYAAGAVSRSPDASTASEPSLNSRKEANVDI